MELRGAKEREEKLRAELSGKVEKIEELKERLARTEKSLNELQMNQKFEVFRLQKIESESSSTISSLRSELEQTKNELSSKAKSLELLNNKLNEMKWTAMAQETNSKIAEREKYMQAQRSQSNIEYLSPQDGPAQPASNRVQNMIHENSNNDRLLHQKIKNLEARINEERQNSILNSSQIRDVSRRDNELIANQLLAKIDKISEENREYIRKNEKLKAENKIAENKINSLSQKILELETLHKLKEAEL